MKKLLIIGFMLLLVGCSNESEIEDSVEHKRIILTEERVVTEESVIVEELIQKDLEEEKMELERDKLKWEKEQSCLDLKPQIESKLLNKKSEFFGDASLEQIFYSSKANSCLYVEFSENEIFDWRRLFDIKDDGPSSHPLESCTTPSVETIVYCGTNEADALFCKTSMKENCDKFNEKLKEYK